MISADALYLVDASGFVFRAYHALPPLSIQQGPRQGQPTGAVYGFAQMLIKLEQEHHPSHLAVVWDQAGRAGFRDRIYPGYKANRVEAPADLQEQFAKVREVVDAFRIASVAVSGCEADDVIATLAHRAREAGLRVVIVSSDKDLMQLIDETVRMVRPVWQGGPKGAMQDKGYGPEEVVERYGVPPQQLGDVLALMGDAIDNIPGIKGIGEKTASALIGHFGSLEALLARLDDVPQVPKLRGADKVRRLLAEHADQARLSRRLVALDENVPLPADLALETLRRPEPDMARIETLFRELEFGRLLDRLRPPGSPGSKDAREAKGPSGGATVSAEARAGGAPVPHGNQALPGLDGPATGATAGASAATAPAAALPSLFPAAPGLPAGWPPRIVDSADALAALVGELRSAGEFALSVETTGNGSFAPLCGIAFATDGTGGAGAAGATGEARPSYLPLGHRYIGCPRQVDPALAVEALRPLLADGAVRKHVHGAKEALLGCMTVGLPIAGLVGDPDLAAFLLDPTRIDERQKNKPLSQIAAVYGAVLDEKEAICGRGRNAVGYEMIDIPRAAAYAARRAEATLALSRLLRPAVERHGMIRLLDEVELPLARVLAIIERHGVRIDTGALSALGVEMASRMEGIEREVTAVAGYEVNLGSPQQLQDLLFGKLQLTPTKKTKTGWSTDAEVLEKLAEENPVAAKILEHRGLAKLKGTYVDALPGLVNPKTGRLHTSYHQTVAGTGRLSSSDPNLQNIPIRSDVGRLIRRAFVADPGNLLVAADYSQIELRVLAHLSRDPVLLEAFRTGEDVHTRTAREMFGVADAAVTSGMRRVAKAINYGLAYGQSDFGLARAVGIERERAREYIASYFARYTELRRYLEQLVGIAYQEGGTRTLFGRFRPLPELSSSNRQIRQMGERMARNTPIQGTAADLLKMAMIRVQDRLEREFPSGRMLLTVHDELVLEAPASEAAAVGELVKEVMEGVHALAVPLCVEVGIGANWAEC